MKLAAAGAILAVASVTARAETSLEEYSANVSHRSASQLSEAACDLDVQLRGAVATVEMRHRFVNAGPSGLAASYLFDLPRGATLTGFSLRNPGGTEQALAIPGAFNTVDVDARPVLEADPAIVEALPEGSPASYALRLQALAPEREVTVTLRYTALAEIRAGALRLVLPAHTQAATPLAPCRGSLRAVSGPGATVGKVRVDGTEAGTRGAAAFVVDGKPVVLEAELGFATPKPVVWTQTEALANGWSTTLVTVAAPLVRTTTSGVSARRALFVIDGSRSMELVGRHNTTKVMRTIAAALPADTTIDAILYDRTATRVLGAWRPADPQTLTTIEKAMTTRAAVNGSNLTGALKLANTAINDGGRDTTLVVVISDGVIGDVRGVELIDALGAKTNTVDVLAVVLDPARTESPGAAALLGPVSAHGGSFVEVNIAELDDALTVVDEWLRPSWLDLSLGGDDAETPTLLRAGSGFTRTLLHRNARPTVTLTGSGASTIKIAPRAAPRAPIATLVLADPQHAEERAVPALRAEHPYVRDGLAFAVLARTSKVAKSRHAMVRGGGPYERVVDVFDPPEPPIMRVPVGTTRPSAIAKITLERLFRDQLQPKAYACYQRALGNAPKLAGTVHFDLRLGRGEVTAVALAGLADPQLDACLLDAAYALTLPLPDFTINADDQTVAHYPLTFAISESRPQVVLGDADSTSPLDIDAIPGGVPTRKPVNVDTATPLGTMRPTKQP